MNFKNIKINTLFASLLLGTATVSCQVFEGEKEMMTEDSKIYKATGLSDSPNIIYQETFEGDDPFSFAHMQYAESYSFGTTENPAFDGAKSARFELNDTDPEASGGTRSEALFPEVSDEERWYSYNLYIPSEDYDRDSNYDIITQWHQGSGSGSPTLTFRITNDHFELEHGDDASRREEYEIAPVIKDRWHDLVFHVIHSSGSDGLVEIWLNGDKVLTLEGGNMDRDYDLPRWKVGIYKDDWNGSETTDTDRRVLYFDNVRLGNRNATFEEMTSLGSTSPEEETTTEEPDTSNDAEVVEGSANSLTLINTSSDEAEGDFLSGANLIAKDHRLSILANFADQTPAEVRFDLSGAANRSNVDDAAPFALNGDNGNGDFWYGEGLYPGDYELLVTPSYEVNGQLVEGTPVLYTFTIESGSENIIDIVGESATEIVEEEETTSTPSSSINYLSLINTSSDQEELTFNSGADITAIDHRLSIVPDFDGEQPAEVRFDLSGASNRSNVDAAAPFALNGDNGSGDFWYGEGLYPGDYQLVVTPYYDVNGELVAGSAQTFDFSLEEGDDTYLN